MEPEGKPVEQPDFPRKPPNVPTVKKYTRGSNNARRMLAQLQFDPIAQMIVAYQEVDKEIAEMNELKQVTMVREDGSVRKYSSMAHGQLLVLKQKIINDLLRYGYARIPESVNINSEKPSAFVLNLHTSAESFKLANEQGIEDAKLVDEEDDS
jgi:hypothetical protein